MSSMPHFFFEGKSYILNRTASRFTILQHPMLATATIAMLALAGMPRAASAQTIALNSVRGAGNQSFTGALGMRFDALAPITVTSLGAFDSGQNGFTNAINVGIFNADTQVLVPGLSATLTTATTTAIGQSRFLSVAPVILSVGHYEIVAQGFSSADPNGNAGISGTAPSINTGGGAINFVGTAYYIATQSLVYVSNPDTGPANRYDAGTFVFSSASAPEPGSVALLTLSGVPVVGMVIRRQRKTA